MFDARDAEIVLAGPAGTGKTRGILEFVHRCLLEHPGARALIVRKVLTSLTSTALVTFRNQVLDPRDPVTFFGGNKQLPAAYQYRNGSQLVVGGLDKATKIMSSEYDLVVEPEMTDLTEGEHEMLGTRCRNGVLPWQMQVGDCNPDRPDHWIQQRAQRGQLHLMRSVHKDNPRLWDDQRCEWTEYGAAYMARLDQLTGVRRLRLRDGIWAAAEGMVYEGWDTGVHVIDSFPLPREWPRYWVLDFGYTNPFVCQYWAEDPDGRLCLYREIYHTGRLVKDHAHHAMRLAGAVLPEDATGRPRWVWPEEAEPKPVAVIADHDAEGRATWEYETGLSTQAARKEVSRGIQATAERLRVQPDGKPRLLLFRDALVEMDPELRETGKPTCTADEVPGYVWDRSGGRRSGEQPVKSDDHGMDAMRYLCRYRDPTRASFAPY